MVARMTATSFHLAIDDGGEFLVVSGSDIALGNARAGGAEIAFHADLQARHALLRWRTSFHFGPCWSIEPEDPQSSLGQVRVDGRVIRDAHDLAHGEEVRLSPRVAFRFLLPEPASSSAQLQFLHGMEVAGATRALLFVPGAQGRVRIGSRLKRHVAIPGLEHEVSLELGADGLHLRCAGGIREESGSVRNSAAVSTNKTLPCPPANRIDLRVNARPSQPLPFGLSLSPLATYEV